MVQRHLSYGWQPDPEDPQKVALYPFLKVSFPSQRALRDVAQGILEEQKEPRWGKKQDVPIPGDVAALIYRATVESQLDSTQKFLDDWKLTPCGWFQVRTEAIAFATERPPNPLRL